MRIIHVVRQYYPSIGGLEAVVAELTRAQLARGHAVQVVTLDRIFRSKAKDRLPARDKVDDLEVIRIPYRGSDRYPIAPSVLKFIKSADIVHVHAIDFFFDYLAWTKPLHRKPIIASTHGAFFHTSFASQLKRVYFSTITRLSAAWYDKIVAVSTADEALFAKISSNVICIENGVSIEKYLGVAAPLPKKMIISIGRFSSNKRLDRLISFVSELRRRDPDWSLIIAGRRSDLGVDVLASLAERFGIRNAVKIIESPSDQDLRLLMQDCSVIASSSDYEGFGLTAVEGMAAGLFPVLSDIPPFRYLVSQTGVGALVDFSNPHAAADNFLQAWKKVAGQYEEFRAAAIKGARRYEWGPVSEKYERLYETIALPKQK